MNEGNLITMKQRSKEERKELVKKSHAARQRNKIYSKTLCEALKPVIVDFLNEKFPIKENGKEKNIDGRDLILRLLRTELAKGGKNAITLLKILDDILRGAPTVLAQFNYNVQNKNLIEDEDRLKAYYDLMGLDLPKDKEAQDVEFKVSDDTSV